MLYSILLSLHSVLRWLILLAALLVIIRAVNGLRFRRGYTAMDNRTGLWFASLLDIQFLLGLILYFVVSPLTTAALQNFGGAMSNAPVRYFAVEHSLMMFLAVIVIHIGRSNIRKAATGEQKHRRTLIWMGATLLLILVSIPWPFLEAVGRPLLRLPF